MVNFSKLCLNLWFLVALQWRHNDHDSVSNHQPYGCLLNRLFRRRSKKTSKLASLAFVWGIHRDRWIPRTKGQLRGKCFHLMTSSWDTNSVDMPLCARLTGPVSNPFQPCFGTIRHDYRETMEFVNMPLKTMQLFLKMRSALREWVLQFRTRRT